MADADMQAVGLEYAADLAAVADAARCDLDRAAAILARLASSKDGACRLLITHAQWTELDTEIERLRVIVTKLAEGGVPLVAEARGVVRCPMCGAKTRFTDRGDIEESESRWDQLRLDPTWHYASCPWRMAREAVDRG